MLGIKAKCLAWKSLENVALEYCKKKSPLKHFTEKPSLLTFDNLCIIFCPRLSEEAHFHFEIDP